MQPETESTRWTYDDLLRLPEDGKRHEVIGGVHFVSPSPAIPHQTAVVNLVAILVPFVRAHGLGRVFAAPLDVVLRPTDVVEPDLLFVSREREAILERPPHVQGAPDLLVEVLSPSTRRRDLGPKRELYERSGVREYWIVDPDGRWVEVLRATDGRFGRAERLTEADRLATPLLPGLEIPLPELFRA